MASRFTPFARRTIQLIAAAVLAISLTGCIGIYDNSELFRPAPHQGMDELAMLQSYGTPTFTTFVEDQKIYTYKVRENMYIILLGIYDGYDLVVVCEDGRVREITKVDPPKRFSLISPVPWSDTE
ncbi:hypothetical protein KQI84_15990 [bacterium]|nr:hypothetical protein [bacterium]